MSTWNGSPQRELTTNPLSGKLGADQTFTDENPPAPANPVASASRSAAAHAKASRQHDETGRPYRSFRGLLDHLATLPRNQVRFAGGTATIPMLTEPTTDQREAFHLIGADEVGQGEDHADDQQGRTGL
jgi:hypothetical protein